MKKKKLYVIMVENSMAFDFFIQACDRGYSVARTFIIEDMGYDLFPMSWERVEGLAAANESHINPHCAAWFNLVTSWLKVLRLK